MKRPEEYDHFIITDLGTITALQDDWRFVIEPVNPSQEDQVIVYNGMKVLPMGIMIGRNKQNFNEPFKPDIFDRNGTTAIFADQTAKYVDSPIIFE